MSILNRFISTFIGWKIDTQRLSNLLKSYQEFNDGVEVLAEDGPVILFYLPLHIMNWEAFFGIFWIIWVRYKFSVSCGFCEIPCEETTGKFLFFIFLVFNFFVCFCVLFLLGSSGGSTGLWINNSTSLIIGLFRFLVLLELIFICNLSREILFLCFHLYYCKIIFIKISTDLYLC